MNANLSPSQFSSLAEGHEPDDGHNVTLYHRTRTPEAAASIRQHGFQGSVNPIDRGDVYLSSHPDGKAASYGGHLLAVSVPHTHAHMSHVDTWEHGGGEEHWYALPADKIDPRWVKP